MTSLKSNSQAKIISTVLILSAIALYLSHWLIPLPPFLESILSVVQVVLLIHAVEGAIAAILILRYRQRLANDPAISSENPDALLLKHLPTNTPLAVVKAGLYTFFVGTVGLSEIFKETQRSSAQTS